MASLTTTAARRLATLTPAAGAAADNDSSFAERASAR